MLMLTTLGLAGFIDVPKIVVNTAQGLKHTLKFINSFVTKSVLPVSAIGLLGLSPYTFELKY